MMLRETELAEKATMSNEENRSEDNDELISSEHQGVEDENDIFEDGVMYLNDYIEVIKDLKDQMSD